MVKCECGAENPEVAKFCNECGVKLSNTIITSAKEELDDETEQNLTKFLTMLQNGEKNIFSDENKYPILTKNEISILMKDISLFQPLSLSDNVKFPAFLSIVNAKAYNKLKMVDQGDLLLTNKRLIFFGSKKNSIIYLRRIIAMGSNMEGISVLAEGHQPKYFLGTDRSKINFKINNSQTTTPLFGTILEVAIKGSRKNEEKQVKYKDMSKSVPKTGYVLNGSIIIRFPQFLGYGESRLFGTARLNDNEIFITRYESISKKKVKSRKHVKYADITKVELKKKKTLKLGRIHIYTQNRRYTIEKKKNEKLKPFYDELKKRVDTNKEIISVNLIPCPICGHNVSVAAKSCPNCGHPLRV